MKTPGISWHVVDSLIVSQSSGMNIVLEVSLVLEYLLYAYKKKEKSTICLGTYILPVKGFCDVILINI